MNIIKARLTAAEHYLPATKITNKYFADKFSVSESNIYKKTGIISRYFLQEGATSDLIVPAINNILTNNNLLIDDIECLIVATITPDYQFPSTAAVVLNKLNAAKTYGYDISASCAGFIYALSIGSALIESGKCKKVLICGADKMSSTLNFDDFKTSVLFGDGAGVVLLESTEKKSGYIYETICKLDNSGLLDVYIPSGGTASELTSKGLEANENKIFMSGRKVFDSGVKTITNSIRDFLIDRNKKISDIDYIIPHQANKNMLLNVIEILSIPYKKILINIEEIGNTSAASIPICISQFQKKGFFKPGDRILLCAFGSGYTYGISYLTWPD